MSTSALTCDLLSCVVGSRNHQPEGNGAAVKMAPIVKGATCVLGTNPQHAADIVAGPVPQSNTLEDRTQVQTIHLCERKDLNQWFPNEQWHAWGLVRSLTPS
eukprot:3693114-Amphidinium_carterae.1